MAEAKPRKIALAVQGGGAHGAFSWGVLDRLLDEVAAGRLEIAALSGTSAGGFNAALVAYGLGRAPGAEGAAEARRLLQDFWIGDSRLAPFSPYTTIAGTWHYLTGSWNIDSCPAVLALDLLGQMHSPYGAPAIEWLKIAVDRAIDFDELRAQTKGPELYITATNINHNRRDIFARPAITFDVLAASATLPLMFPARPLVIDGREEFYWDGGYMGNPSLCPLTAHCEDLVVIQINPFERPDSPPKTAPAILERLNEINFNASLVLELSALAAANAHRERPIRLHAIADEPTMVSLGNASKFVIVREFLEELREKGRTVADAWLAAPDKGGQVGRATTLDPDILEKVVTREPVIRTAPHSRHAVRTRTARPATEKAPPS